jgi:hypothetical protein
MQDLAVPTFAEETMSFKRLLSEVKGLRFALVTMCALLLLVVSAPAQEVTGSMQGTVTDPSGAIVPGAHLTLTGTTLIGSKEADSDGQGQYHFANLPPGTYTIKVVAKGFEVLQRGNLAVQVGQLPIINLQLQLGSATSTIEVTTAAPLIDTTTNTNLTDLTETELNNTPHGYSYQSVIQYAPMARNEPLEGELSGGMNGMQSNPGSPNMSGNSGGSLPGSAGNGLAVGFSIGGAADSESSYLVDGQDTENVSGGASNANVPFPFIQEVQVKTSGIQAEYGGALGGVINVITKKGGNEFHGSLFTSYESDAMDGSANATLRTDPLQAPLPTDVPIDPPTQSYSPKKDHYRTATPGFTLGGPIVKDRLWFFLGFDPEYNSDVRTVNFAPSSLTENQALGYQDFSEDTQQYFSTARLDFAATQKIRLYASWLYQYDRASGVSLPNADPIASQQALPDYLNTSINSPLTQYSHGLGYAAPNATYNFGADITLTPEIVSTTRFGYFFDDYHDIGWPTTGVDLDFQTPGVGVLDNTGAPLPTELALPAGATTAPFDQSYTEVNASKHYQFNQDVQFFKSGWWGTHNIKVGYQFNRLWNEIDQHGNLPFVETYVGPASQGVTYGPSTSFGGANCALLTTEWGGCTGQYGYVTVQDFATILKNSSGQLVPAIDNNHALYAQDAWTIGHGFTFNLGLRVEKENLPAPPGIGIAGISSINFPWTDKIEPRLGVAWGSPSGKLKLFGSYGVVNDVMKLLLAQTSFGAQGYEDCTYPLGPDGTPAGFTNADITLVANAAGRSCPTGVSNVGATFSGPVPPSLMDPSGVSLIENVNYRPEEPVAPNVKPYRQHEYTAGADYALGTVWALEVRYDRRRLDHVIEDASLADPEAFEIYTVVNPGQGVDRTLDGYANFLTSLGDAYGPGTAAFNANDDFGTCPTCPPNPKAIRNYDGVEIRLTKRMSNNWAGDFAYTWSSLWGNYTGLTTTDQTDGGTTGRNSPDTTRAFDEPFYYFKYNGQSNAGPLPTDRPNTLKGDVYYNVHWMGMTSTIGLFQTAYEGSPVTSWADVGIGDGSPIEGTDIWGRGNWVNATIDDEGNVTLGNVYARRTPWYTQTDMTLQHAIKVNKNNESQVLTFSANFTNLLNQHAVTAYWAGLNSDRSPSALFQYGIFGGAAFYQQVETGYNPQAAITASGVPLNSEYGKPNLWQLSRNIRLGVEFDF